MSFIHHQYVDSAICPWCGHDAGELESEDYAAIIDHKCKECGKKFTVMLHKIVKYSTHRQKCPGGCESMPIDKAFISSSREDFSHTVNELKLEKPQDLYWLVTFMCPICNKKKYKKFHLSPEELEMVACGQGDEITYNPEKEEN